MAAELHVQTSLLELSLVTYSLLYSRNKCLISKLKLNTERKTSLQKSKFQIFQDTSLIYSVYLYLAAL